MVDEEARTLVDSELLHQGRADAHGHRTDYLAARGLRVQDAAAGAHGEHAPHTDLGGCGIDADFHEVRAERRLLVPSSEVAEFYRVFGDETAFAARLGKRQAAAA